jgi:hypothetical protein
MKIHRTSDRTKKSIISRSGRSGTEPQHGTNILALPRTETSSSKEVSKCGTTQIRPLAPSKSAGSSMQARRGPRRAADEPLATKVFRKKMSEKEVQTFLEEYLHISAGVPRAVKLRLVHESLDEVGNESLDSLFFLIACMNEEDFGNGLTWSDRARIRGTAVSTETKRRDKAVPLFMNAYLRALHVHLVNSGKEKEAQRLGEYLGLESSPR